MGVLRVCCSGATRGLMIRRRALPPRSRRGSCIARRAGRRLDWDKRALCRYHIAWAAGFGGLRAAPLLGTANTEKCAPYAMKCLICGRLSLPGAKLCLDCKSARKRAFDATVTQPLLAAAGATRRTAVTPRLLKPGQSVPDAARRAAKMALAAQARIEAANETPEVAPRSAARWPMVVGAVLAIAVVIGYIGHSVNSGKSDSVAAVPDRSNLESSAASSGAQAGASTAIPAPSPTAVVPSTGGAAGVEEPQPKPDLKRAPLKARQEKIAPPPPVPEPPPPPPAVAVAPPAPPPVIREAPRLDPFQIMSDAIARCPRDFSARASCEQRLRAQYCEGHWGEVPQCASIPYVDHGS